MAWIKTISEEEAEGALARQYAAAVAGLTSVMCWVAAELPQIYTNYRAGSADGMAPAFLAAWLAGARGWGPAPEVFAWAALPAQQLALCTC